MATDLYVKKDWQTGETITEAALDNLEKGVSDANTAIRTMEANAFTSIQVTTLNAGEQATATVEGGVLKLGIPKGADGAKGDKGDPGADGEDGAPGAKGDKGDKGDTGANGTDGEDGAPGAAGKQGASYRISTETFTASKADCQASAVTPAASVLPIIVGDLIEDATRAVWQVESVADGTFTVGAAAVRNAPAA